MASILLLTAIALSAGAGAIGPAIGPDPAGAPIDHAGLGGGQSLVPRLFSTETVSHSEPFGPSAASTGAHWINLSGPGAPSARYGAAMAFDGALNTLVLFGGFSIPRGATSSTDPLLHSDTWEYTNGTWQNVTSSVGPAPMGRGFASFTYDARDGYLLLVGGLGSSWGATGDCQSWCHDMWRFNGTSWSAVALPNALAPAGFMMASYDSTGQYVVVTDTLNTGVAMPTFAYSGGSWTNLTAAGGGGPSTYPPVTIDSALVDLPSVGGLLLYGGGMEVRSSNSTTYVPSTWVFQAGTWTNITANLTANPPEQWFPAITYDPSQKADILFDQLIGTNGTLGPGSTWAFNGSWTELSLTVQPPKSFQGGLAWDGAINGSILFGGSLGLNYPPPLSNETWEFTPTPGILGLGISASTDPVDAKVSLTFAATIDQGTPPFTYAWTFGDGRTSPNATPSHAYATPGTYGVKLSIVDAAHHSRSASLQVEVVSDPTVAPTAQHNPSDAGVPTAFASGLLGGTGEGSFEWHFGDGGSSSAAAPSHTYGSAGSFRVDLWMNDSGGGRVVANLTEKVNAALSVSISASPSAPSLGQLVNFSATASGGTTPYTFSWAFGDGGIGGDLANISHVFTTNGPFSATVLVVDGAGGLTHASDNLSVALNLSILANWAFGAAPLGVSFAAHVEGGLPAYSYRWSFGDGGVSEASTPNHTYRTPGFFTAVLTVEDLAGHSAQSSWDVLVAPGGGPVLVSLTTTSTFPLVGSPSTVAASVSGGEGGYTIDWSASSGLACTGLFQLSEQCSASRAGSYDVSLRVSDQTGSTSSSNLSLLVGSPGTLTPPPASTLTLWGALGGMGPFLAGLAVGIAALLGAPFLLAGRRTVTTRRGEDDRLYARYAVRPSGEEFVDADSTPPDTVPDTPDSRTMDGLI